MFNSKGEGKMETSKYRRVFNFRCNYCMTFITLENDISEVIDNKPAFVGIQCESFFEHLEEHHDIHYKEIVIDSTGEKPTFVRINRIEDNFTFVGEIERAEIKISYNADYYNFHFSEIDNLLESIVGLKKQGSGMNLNGGDRDIDFEGETKDVYLAIHRLKTFEKIAPINFQFAFVDTINDREFIGCDY